MTEMERLLCAKNAKLANELELAIAELREFSYCQNCGNAKNDSKYTKVCKLNNETHVWNHSCRNWYWKGVQNNG